MRHHNAFSSLFLLITSDDLLGSVAPGDALLQPESLFDGSLSSLLSEPTPNSRQPLENDGPMEALPEQNLKRATDSAKGSDSENASPQHPYPINSPARRSSSTVTPPTSPFGELGSQETLDQSGPSTMATKKGSSNKGKGKEPKTKVFRYSWRYGAGSRLLSGPHKEGDN